jgi:hypothetical protein
VFRIKSSRVVILKIFCGAAAHFSSSDLRKNGIVADGHCFIKTRFALHSEQGTFPLYFCRCGEMAVRHADVGQTICRLADDGASES